MKEVKVNLPFTGGSIHGEGIIRQTTTEDKSFYNKVFENPTGKIFFNDFTDRQVKGMQFTISTQSLQEAIEYVRKAQCDVHLGTPYLLLGDVQYIIHLLTGDLSVPLEDLECNKDRPTYYREPCPKCDGVLEPQWSGVICSKCKYTFCY